MQTRFLLLVVILLSISCNEGSSNPILDGQDNGTPGADGLTSPDSATEPEDTTVPPGDVTSPEDVEVPPDLPPPADTVLPDLAPVETIEPGDPPTPVVGVVEGQEVIPQTVLHLSADWSIPSSGKITAWQWTADQPEGSVSLFIPSATFPNPSFEVNVAGLYTFYLDVWDQFGQQSAQPAIMQIQVIPDQTIHVELLWHTPDDPDETDEGPEAGADLDLHFVHPQAGGPDRDGDGEPDGWFDQPFDCFWFNAHPEWGSFNPEVDDNPGLDRDDTDGAGPENINLNIPEAVTYRVGVHHWNDHGYGPSYATVRVYIDGVLVWESELTKLMDSDMWEVIHIIWTGDPADPWQLSTDDAKITPDYQNPFFFQD